jgi:hypothetical protein
MSIFPSPIGACYDYVIGLSRTECDCYDPKTGYELDYNTSDSGLYLDEVHPLNNIAGLENCDNGDVWRIMANARERAINTFIADTNALISKYYQLKYRPYTGIIGRVKNDKDLTLTNTYAGIIVRCNPIKSGEMVIRAIGTLMNYTGTLDVTIYDNLNTNHGTYTLNCTADTFVLNTLTSPLTLDLFSEYVDVLEYYFIYTIGANQPRNNDLSCMCGSFRPTYSTKFPYYTKAKPKEYGWANYVMVGGVATDDLDFMNLGLSGSNYLNGLLLSTEFRCKVGEALCKDELDFIGDPISGAIAHAILYGSSYNVADHILTTGEINRPSLMNHEQLVEYQKEWKGKYDEMITYIVENLDLSKSDCIECRDKIFIHRAGILV